MSGQPMRIEPRPAAGSRPRRTILAHDAAKQKAARRTERPAAMKSGASSRREFKSSRIAAPIKFEPPVARRRDTGQRR